MVASALQGRHQRVIPSTKAVAETEAEAKGDLETSLRELGADSIDIWSRHFRDEPKAVTDEPVRVREDANREGRIRHISVGTHNPAAIADRVIETGKIEVVLSVYNFAIGSQHDAAFDCLHRAGVGLVAMKVMAPAARAFGFRSSGKHMEQPVGALAALKWVLRDPRFATTIPGMTDIEQLEENFRAMAEPFGPKDEKLPVALNGEIRPLYCRLCYRCSGQCPKGEAVPETLRLLAYADCDGRFALGRGHFLALPESARSVRCRDCPVCAVRCPNGVRLAERMICARELFA